MDIVIHYPNGRDDHVAVCDGSSVLGSAEGCDVVLSDAAVEKRQLRLQVSGNAFEVENLVPGSAVWLNDHPLSDHAPFVFGDTLRIGAETITLQAPYVSAPDKTRSPDGIRKMRESIARDVRAGWLGYRRVMEKLSSFVSKKEARLASECYESGRRAFSIVFSVSVVGTVAASFLKFFEWYGTAGVLELCLQFFLNVAILLLVGRYRMSFAGRVLFPVLMLANGTFLTPDCSFSDYWSGSSWIVATILVLLVLIGWVVDFGAGFVFEENRRKRLFRFSLLVLTSFVFVGLSYINEAQDPSPVRWYWSIIAESPCLVWGLVYRRFQVTRVPFDSLFVAEIASRRAWKRMLYQGLAIVLLVIPVVSILSLLGEGERREWPENDLDVLWTDGNAKDEAWFWEERGRYLKKSDLDSNQIYQVPVSALTKPASSNDWVQAVLSFANALEASPPSVTNQFYHLMERISSQKRQLFLAAHPDIPDEDTPEYDKLNEACELSRRNFVLSDLATNVCSLVHAISTNADDVASYTALCELLSDCRVSATNVAEFAKSLGMDAVCVVCDRIERHREYAKEPSYICSAGFKIGVFSFTRERVAAEQGRIAKQKTGILLVSVLATLAFLVFYRRGADSSVGFWLGLGLFANAITLTEVVAGFADGVPEYVKYAIWRGAVSNPCYSLLASWLSTTMAFKDVFKGLGYLSQTVLFVILCWPTVRSMGKWKRCWAFVGKALLAFAVVCVVRELVGFVYPSYVCERVAVVLTLGTWGWLLRRKRRQFTELPRLGIGFFLGWLIAEVAIGVLVEWTGTPGPDSLCYLHDGLSMAVNLPLCNVKVELGMLLGIFLPILVVASWLWLFLKQKFMNVLSLGGITLIFAVFVLPVIFRVVSTAFAGDVHDNALLSRSGMRLVSAIVVVIIVPALVRNIRKFGRRLFMRNVYRMEQEVAASIEKIFDESTDKVKSIFDVLSCMRISSFAFYERVSRDDFRMLVSRDWAQLVPETLSVSEPLRRMMGEKREVIDFDRLPYQPELLFVSSELWRMHLETRGALVLPICLGKSVRGLLFVDSTNVDNMPSDNALVESINSLGLSTVTPR